MRSSSAVARGLLLVMGWQLTAFAAGDTPTTSGAAADDASDASQAASAADTAPSMMPTRIRLRPRKNPTPNERYTEQMVFGPVERVNASDAIDEILDELAADVAFLGAAQVSPVLIDHVGVSQNMNPEFARILQSRIVSVLHRVAEVDVQRCYECEATIARVEQAEWVVSRGLVNRADFVAVAKQYRSKVVLSADLTLHENPTALSLDVQMVRAADAAIVFAEQYRFRAEDGLLYRTADRAQSREARLKDLEDRLADRPHYSNSAIAGVVHVPSPDHPLGGITGSSVSYQLLESFGVDREWRYGLSGTWILNPTRLVAIVPAALFGRRFTPDSLYFPRCYALATLGYFMTLEVPQGLNGVRGAPQLGVSAQCTVVHRLGLSAQVVAVPTFPLTDGGYSVGGLVPSMGVSYSW